MSFFEKSFHACSPILQKRWLLFRRFVPHSKRWFFEGCLEIPGQLWFQERRLLYRTMRQHRPAAVFEVGTWRGGGSTYFISHALYDNGGGILHTIETDPSLYSIAMQNYRTYLPHLLPHVCFHHGIASEVYPPILNTLGTVDAIFLDGAQDPHETLREFDLFLPDFRPGSVLLAHDWDNEKMALLRPRLEQSAEWKQRVILTGPSSVGFAVWTYAPQTP